MQLAYVYQGAALMFLNICAFLHGLSRYECVRHVLDIKCHFFNILH